MSLSAGQVAVLQALGEGRGLYCTPSGTWYQTNRPGRINRKHMLPLVTQGLIEHAENTVGRHDLTQAGRDALRALEQEGRG
ncbi:hypothetical protein ASF71_06945 [Deinococcus sp. Leaf326]|nr:hypothetical protein ASF71_06945 [Deinococcus sp. Leaf326]